MSRPMKDSGIAWIGQVPEHWEQALIGSLYKLRNTKVSDKQFEPLSVTMRGILHQLENAAKTNDGDNRKLVKTGDFVINSRSDRRGACGISKYDGSVSLINLVLVPQNNMHPGYYNWLFHTSAFADEFYKWGHGIVDDLWTTRWQDMKNITIPLPSLQEQQRIAGYLDKKCAEIDTLSNNIQQQIDTLEQYKRAVITETVTKGLNPSAPMKDSGIPWIGKVPESWEILPNKYVMHKEKQICPLYNGEPILSLSMDGVLIRDIENPSGKMPASFDGYQKIKAGNLLMCLFDMDVTPRCIGLIKNTGLTSPAYSQFVLHENALAEYFYYYYLSLDFTKELVHLAKNLRHALTEDVLGTIKVPVPPKSEQQAIANYLDDKCGKIDAIIQGKQQQLEKLEQYKKATIFEYVTGKKQVPEV